MTESKRNRKTIVIIEHRLEDVLYKDVDRIVVVGDGTIVADMKPDDLLVGNILEEQESGNRSMSRHSNMPDVPSLHRIIRSMWKP